MKNAVIIVAGGSGQRMGGPVPKQFIEINGKPVVLHSINRFLQFDPAIRIVVVVNGNYMNIWQKIISEHSLKKIVTVEGGETRFHSVKNGLAALDEMFLTGIHDAVRPLIAPEIIRNIYRYASVYGNAVPAEPVKETIRQVNDSGSTVINWSKLRLIQTPQVFHSDILLNAYKTEYKETYTDDASVVEHSGIKINLVDGDPYNIKITTPEDLEIAKALL